MQEKCSSFLWRRLGLVKEEPFDCVLCAFYGLNFKFLKFMHHIGNEVIK